MAGVSTSPQVERPRPDRAAETRSRLEAILNLSRDGILAIAKDGTIVGWNRGAEGIYGYPAAAIIGRQLDILVPFDRFHELTEIDRGIERGGTIEDFETVRLRSDGTPIDVSLSIAPIRDEHGHVTGSLVIVRDITVVQQAMREVAQSTEKLSDRERRLRRALVAPRRCHA